MPPKEELAREYMKAINELRVSGPLYVKPTTDELLKRIQQLSPEERMRLISELEKGKEKGTMRCGSLATPRIVNLLSEIGLIEKTIEQIDVKDRLSR
jgi:hypothetical protein